MNPAKKIRQLAGTAKDRAREFVEAQEAEIKDVQKSGAKSPAK